MSWARWDQWVRDPIFEILLVTNLFHYSSVWPFSGSSSLKFKLEVLNYWWFAVQKQFNKRRRSIVQIHPDLMRSSALNDRPNDLKHVAGRWSAMKNPQMNISKNYLSCKSSFLSQFRCSVNRFVARIRIQYWTWTIIVQRWQEGHH